MSAIISFLKQTQLGQLDELTTGLKANGFKIAQGRSGAVTASVQKNVTYGRACVRVAIWLPK